jgi:hypothetical protein
VDRAVRASISTRVLWAVGGFVALFAGCTAFFSVVDPFSFPDLGLEGDFGPRPTPEERAAAATTVPPSAADCAAINRLAPASAAVARANFDEQLRTSDFASYRQRLTLLLTAFDAHLRAATSAAEGPMRDHLEATRGSVALGLLDLTAAGRSADYNSLGPAAAGYFDLLIADELLGETCGGVLADDGSWIDDLVPPTIGATAVSARAEDAR